jgi:tetrapyrrole methylase family protein/MazG family protein
MENKEIYKNDIERLRSKETFSFDDFVKIVEILRACCPWDREQTHSSIRNNLLEEAYEVVEGIDKNNPAIMQEELGDLMLQVIFHSIMGKEEGNYNLETVIGDICKKLIRRHPHIFASVEANTTNTVLENWDNIKNVEKSNKTLGDELSSITSSLPALMRSEKVCKKIRKRKGETFGGENITMEEAGEALFKLVASCSVSGINPEEALKKYTEKIIENNQ